MIFATIAAIVSALPVEPYLISPGLAWSITIVTVAVVIDPYLGTSPAVSRGRNRSAGLGW